MGKIERVARAIRLAWSAVPWEQISAAEKAEAIMEAEAAIAAYEQDATLRLCGYCKSWHSKPCGEGCCWSASDPTADQSKAA